MSIRILCCSGSLDGGGSERQLWQMVSKLDPEQFSPSVYLLHRRGMYLDQLPQHVPVTDFWTHHANQRFLPGGIHRAQVAHLATTLKRDRIDVVYDRTFHMTLVTAPGCRRTQTPRVSVIVSPPSRDFPASRERFAAIKKKLLRQAYGCPKSIAMAVSQAVADDAAEFYKLPQNRFMVLPNPVDIATIQEAAREKLPDTWTPAQSDRILRVAVVGRFTLEKGQALAIHAVRELQRLEPELRVELDLVGDGPQRSSLEELALASGVGERIHFRGFLTNPYPLMQAADAVLIPSQYEGLPNVALEAMALGTPLITTQCSESLNALIGANQRGIVVAGNTSGELAQAVASLRSQPGEWSARTHRAQAYVADTHGLESWLVSMQRLFLSLAEKRRTA